MISTVVAGPGAVVGVLQLEVLVEVGGRLAGHLLESARSELVVRPALCSLLLLPANIDIMMRSVATSEYSVLK